MRRSNSGNSSKIKIPLCASDISPGLVLRRRRPLNVSGRYDEVSERGRCCHRFCTVSALPGGSRRFQHLFIAQQ
ncbi:hypothetical protein KCP71_05950 [Salmonella enterica subsp. enterica]|nr:hypothetical protein KCP71_05950 [Salmonella enterica subsp. enterica]